MIEILDGFPSDVVAVRCSGQVSQADYTLVLVPKIEEAFARHPKVRIYFETASDLKGFDPGAMWEDFKVGMEHLTGWDRVAVVTDVAWIRHAMQFFAFLLPAKARLFSPQETEKAKAWMSGPGG